MAAPDEGRLRSQLQLAFEKAIDEAMNGIEDPLRFFAPELPLAQRNLVTLLWNGTVRTVTQNILAEFQVICGERDLSTKLNQLDHILSLQPQLSDDSRLPVDFFNKSVEQVMRQRLLVKQLRQKQQKEAELAKLNAENALLENELGSLREALQIVTQNLNTRQQEMDQALDSATEVCNMQRDD